MRKETPTADRRSADESVEKISVEQALKHETGTTPVADSRTRPGERISVVNAINNETNTTPRSADESVEKTRVMPSIDDEKTTIVMGGPKPKAEVTKLFDISKVLSKVPEYWKKDTEELLMSNINSYFKRNGNKPLSETEKANVHWILNESVDERSRGMLQGGEPIIDQRKLGDLLGQMLSNRELWARPRHTKTQDITPQDKVA